MIEIDGKRAVRLLQDQVIKHGSEFVYRRPADPDHRRPPCLYAHGTECGCLIGYALHDAGVPIETLAAMDRHQLATGIGDLPEVFGFELTEQARRIFAAAQGSQDIGLPWGEAVAEAVDVAEELGVEL